MVAEKSSLLIEEWETEVNCILEEEAVTTLTTRDCHNSQFACAVPYI